MLRARKCQNVAAFGGYDPAAAAIFAAFDTPASATRKVTIDAFVKALKAAAVWDSLDLLYVLAAADSQAARINWKNPGVKTATAVNSPTFTVDRGFTGNGSSARLETGWTPSVDGVNYTQNSASAWAWVLNNVSEDKIVIGNNTLPRLQIAPRTTANTQSNRINDGTSLAIASASSIGFHGAQRRASTDRRSWKDGAQIGSDATASTGLPTDMTWILGGSPSSFATFQCALAAVGSALSGKEAAFYSAALAYLQAVGAA